MIKTLWLLFLTAFILSCSTLSMKRKPATSAPFPPVEAETLFANYETLNIELDAPLAELFAKKDKVPFPQNKDIFVRGHLTYLNKLNRKVTLPVEIHMKGFSSLFLCSFPKLELKIKSEDRKQSIFANSKSVDLNTHCAEENDAYVGKNMKASFYNHREALAYRIAEVLEIPTLRARPVFIKYKNTKIPEVDLNPHAYRAFFLEDMASFRNRLNAKEIKGVNDHMKQIDLKKNPERAPLYAFTNLQDSPQMDPEDVSRIALFQALIGNKDWFIRVHSKHKRFEAENEKSDLWNIKIVELPNGKWVPFPQDFSLAGILLNTPLDYFDKVAFNASNQASQQKLMRIFLDKKSEIYSLIETIQQDPQAREAVTRTLDSFYKTIENNM